MPDNKDPLDMTEVLEDISVSPASISDMEFEDDFLDHETNEEKIRRLEEEVSQAQAAALLNFEALRLLINVCKDRGFEPFPGESMPLSKPIFDMTPQELILRNNEATVRIEACKRVNNKEN